MRGHGCLWEKMVDELSGRGRSLVNNGRGFLQVRWPLNLSMARRADISQGPRHHRFARLVSLPSRQLARKPDCCNFPHGAFVNDR